MNKAEKERILSKYYFNTKNPGSYSSAVKLHEILTKKYPGVFSVHFIKTWLNNQDAYALQRQVRRKYKTPKVQVSGLNNQADIDLMSVENISKQNDGVKYLLIVIDVFSRFLLVRPLLNKKAQTVLNAIKDVLSVHRFEKIRTDFGTEFVNRNLKNYLKSENIYFFPTEGIHKANFAERVIRTLRLLIFRLIQHQRSYKYIDHLQDLVKNYNSSPHRSLKGLSPSEITKENEAHVWSMLYLQPKTFRKTPPHFKFKVGSLVRISHLKHPFRRAYQQQYTTEVFKIKSKIMEQGFTFYKLIDLKNEQITGYVKEHEIIPVDKNEEFVAD